MGRGRQKAKQQKIARKLKYLTTDTDYVELAKELQAQEPGQGSCDPFTAQDGHEDYQTEELTTSDTTENVDTQSQSDSTDGDDLDEYAKWAAEAAAKAGSADHTAQSASVHLPAHHGIPMPAPKFLHK